MRVGRDVLLQQVVKTPKSLVKMTRQKCCGVWKKAKIEEQKLMIPITTKKFR